MNSNSISSMEEKPTVSSPDELPFIPEKYSGKVCCLCNLGERSALGQGDLLKLEVPYNGSIQKTESNAHADVDNKDAADRLKKVENNEQTANRRLKGVLKKGVPSGSDCTYELDKVGHAEIMDINTLQCEGFIYVHRMCGMWSLRRNQITDIAPAQLASVLSECLTQKCSFCGQFGATLTCKMNCSQIHHWPCAAASGSFLILESFTVFCVEHLSQVPLLCSDNNVECQLCSSLGDLSKLIICCTCGDHFHSTCIGLANFPDTRSGWNCARCSKCQICRQQDSNDIRYVKCEQCQKIYHTTCLRPIISSIPKYGWKCNRCRVCTDCGSRTPGAGASSRWHCHYTICDSCYQQRNKGFSCPICQKAYRAASYKEMVKCSWCHKFVHSSCDEEADLNTYHKKKEINPDYDYICPHCKFNSQLDQPTNEDIFATPQISEIFCKDSEVETFEKNGNEIVSCDEQQTKLPASSSNSISNKKRVCLPNIRGKVGKFVLQRPGMLPQMQKKRNTRGKGRQLILQNSYVCGSAERYVNRSVDSDCSSEKKMLLCSARDKFILTQDICVMCGSLGIGSDAAMITCTQCGQCYHPYCVNVKPSKIMMDRGWRCLDCTICEGCGKKNDEARLLLCDECDISYHIYCVDPPLETVPHGNWKCKSCAVCQKCGRNPVGKNASECYFECGPCSSQSACSICAKAYKEGETIIQCADCDHWGHFDCDTINKQLNSAFYESNLYQCSQCRFSNKLQKPKVTLSDQAVQNQKSSNVNIKIDVDRLERNITSETFENSEVLHWVDGVCISEHGLNMIKSLTTEIKRKRKLRQLVGNANKDEASMLGGSALVSALEDAQGDAKPITENYKDGMIWENTDNTPPEGFTIFTNDEGVNILRKKRQRNLQKLGIGGFSVRNRAMKKENDDGGGTEFSGNLEKKKKVARKKQKNKLSEAYPVYLQEAFFGRFLLDSEEIPSYDSESSDGLDSFSMRMHFNSAEQVNNRKNINNDIANLTAEKVIDGQKKCKLENTTSEGNDKFPEALIMDNPPKQTQSSQLAFKASSGVTQNDSIFTTDTATSIIGTEKRVPADRVVDNFAGVASVKTPILVPNFNELEKVQISVLNSNKVEKFSMPVGGQVGQNHNPDLSQMQSTFLVKPPQASNSMQQIAMTNAVEVTHMQNKIKMQTMTPQNVISNEPTHSGEARLVDSVVSEGIIGGTQKTAEKMRRDEDLGSMATISAVLYANTKHPDLKEMYPNWNDRCKQILKRWRSLSTEKKAPFLQLAKDNRSALRMRRAQQEQQKTNLQQKANKEEELERAWKQHQSKIKESQANMFANYSTLSNNDAGFVGCNPKPETKANVPPYQSDNYFSKTNPQRCLVRTVSASPNLKLLSQGSIDFDTESSHVSEKIGDKKLRNLLQKQNSGPPMIGDHVDPFLSTDLYKISMQTNSNMRHNNPMLSNSDKSDTSELRQSFHPSLDSEIKSRSDLKIGEPTESVSVATAELEKLESDENGGFGDILGGLGEGDDDDLLKSLTSEIGDDFNILEYADPELDVLASSQSVLNTLDFEDNDKSA